MGVLYLDRGPGFVAQVVAEVCRRLGIALLHGERRYPEGHGKIERFNQTGGHALLRSLSGRADVDPDCAALAHVQGIPDRRLAFLMVAK
ncbi:MAG: hypothetical protein M9894_00425 [Planctomycetes bacterium]|nr:hypothetical protein [Planctomycetota bacterium]